MITPALDLQGAAQFIVQVGTQTAQPTGETSSGEFGAAFTASLSGTSAAAGSSNGEAAVVPLVPKALASNQLDGSAQTSTARASAATVRSTSERTGQKTGSALASLGGREYGGVLQQESEAPTAAASAKSATLPIADTTLVVKAMTQQTQEGSGISLEVQAKNLATSNASRDGSVDGQEIASASLQGVLANVSGSSVEKTAASQTSSKAAGTESSSKSKATGQALGPTPSHLATSFAASDVLVAGLVSSASPGALLATSVSSSTTAHGLNAGVGAVSALSSQLVQTRLAIPGVSTTQPALAPQVGAEAGRSGALAAWGSVETTGLSTAKPSAARDLSGQLPQDSSTSDAGPTGKSTGGAFALPAGQLTTNADRSTAIAVPTSSTISGEQREPSIADDSSGGRPGLPGGSILGRLGEEKVSGALQSTGVASAGSIAANSQATAAVSTTTVSKTSSGKTNVATSLVQPGAASKGVAGSSTALLEAPAGTQRGNAQTAASSESQDSGAGSNARPGSGQARSIDVQAVSTRNLAVSSAAVSQASQPSASRSGVSDRAKAVGTSGAASASLPASTLAAQDSIDRGASSDSTSSVAATHVAGVVAAEHIVVPANFDGAGTAAAISTSQPSPAFHQGVISTPAASALHSGGAVGSLTATAETELGSSVSMAHAAASSEPHQTLEATPTSLEVGVHSGTQGWLKIRAEVGGEGQVSASLATASPSGDQILKGQLPALNAYLHSEQISLTASIAERTGIAHGVVAHDAGGSALQSGAGSTSGQDASLLQNGANQSGLAHGGRSEGDGSSGVPSRIESQVPNAASYAGRVEISASSLQSATQDSSGQWLNVTV